MREGGRERENERKEGRERMREKRGRERMREREGERERLTLVQVISRGGEGVWNVPIRSTLLFRAHLPSSRPAGCLGNDIAGTDVDKHLPMAWLQTKLQNKASLRQRGEREGGREGRKISNNCGELQLLLG